MTKSTTTNKMVVVGYGYLGSRICGILSGERSIQNSWRKTNVEGLEIAAVVEPNADRARSASRQLPGIPVVERIDQLDSKTLGDERIFIRDFAPLSERARLLDFAISNQINVLLEKPIPEICLFDEGGKHSIRVGVGMSEVNNPVVAGMRYLSRKHFSHIHFVGVARVNSIFDIRRSSDSSHRTGIEGGAFLDKMIHDLHLLDTGHYLGWPARSIEFGRLNDMKFDPETGEDVYSDVSLKLATMRDNINVRLLSSWAGVPSDLHERLRIDPSFVERSTLTYKLEGSGLVVSNLKIAVISGINHNGQDVSIVGNLQSRGNLSAGIWMTEEGKTSFREIRFNVPILETIKSFVYGKHTTLRDVTTCHKVAYMCSKALSASQTRAQRTAYET